MYRILLYGVAHVCTYIHTNTASSISFSLRAVCLDAIEETYNNPPLSTYPKKRKKNIPFIVVNPTS